MVVKMNMPCMRKRLHDLVITFCEDGQYFGEDEILDEPDAYRFFLQFMMLEYGATIDQLKREHNKDHRADPFLDY